MLSETTLFSYSLLKNEAMLFNSSDKYSILISLIRVYVLNNIPKEKINSTKQRESKTIFAFAQNLRYAFGALTPPGCVRKALLLFHPITQLPVFTTK